MDFGNTPKIAPASAAGIVARADIVATNGGVAVDLAPEKTVQSAQAGDAVRVDIRQRGRSDGKRDAAQDERADADRQQEEESRRRLDLRAADLRAADLKDVIQRRLIIEPTTRSIVMEKKNVETGETVQTLPDEATLKLRRYSREIAERARLADDATARYVERTA